MVDQATADAGDEPLDPELAAAFDRLVAETESDGVKVLLRRYKKQLVEAMVTCAEALQSLAREELMASPYNLPKAVAGAIKVAFASPTGHKSPGNGNSPQGSKNASMHSIEKEKAASCALGSKEVTVDQKFPDLRRDYDKWGLSVMANMRGQDACCTVPFTPEATEFLVETVIKGALRVHNDYLFDTEASIVQLMRSVFHDLCVVLALTESTAVQAAEALSDLVEVESTTATSSSTSVLKMPPLNALKLGMEKWIHVQKALKGRIELEFLQKGAEGSCVFKGAMEVGLNLRGRDLSLKIDQAEKECIAMWCWNALQRVYDDVWVLLFDGETITRITFQGFNTPGNQTHPSYQEGMACHLLRGQFTCTTAQRLWRALPGCDADEDTVDAVLTMVGGLIRGSDPGTKEELQKRLQTAEMQLQAAAADRATTAMSKKRKRQEQ